jgi:hypothetical protein
LNQLPISIAFKEMLIFVYTPTALIVTQKNFFVGDCYERKDDLC